MEAIILRPKTKRQLSIFKSIAMEMGIPFEIINNNENPYDPEFVAKILRSKKDFEEGRVTVIKTENLFD